MTAEAIANGLGLRRVAAGVWRGPCPLCGGSRRFQLRDAAGGVVLVYCFGGCGQASIISELRRRNLWPKPAATPEERAAAAAELRRRREAEAVAPAAAAVLQADLERMPPSDPRRRDLTISLNAWKQDPVAELHWLEAHRPDLAAALRNAAARMERRWRRRAWAVVNALADMEAKSE